MEKLELNNVDVVLYALLRLEGHKRKVHTEEIAYEAYQLAKERFGWRLPRFQQMGFPDKELVRSTLLNASSTRMPDGALIEGRSGIEASGKETDGWIFTPLGVSWIRQNDERIARSLGVARPQIRQSEADRFVKQMKGQPLFKSFIITGSIDQDDRYKFTDMLNTSPDAPNKVITLKFDRLWSMAELVGDSDIKRFLAACAQVFPNLLKDIETTEEFKESKDEN